MHDVKYGIFKECFPALPAEAEVFNFLADLTRCKVFEEYEGDVLAGYCAVREDRIVLLCVAPAFRHRGIGSRLLELAEGFIKEKGYSAVTVGGSDSRLFLGEVVTKEEWDEGNGGFFISRGYTQGKGYVEMCMELKDFELDQLEVPVFPENITFKFWDAADWDTLLEAVAKVDPDWVQYFKPGLQVFTAVEDGECAGFAIVSEDDVTLRGNGSNRVGNVGCVGVVPEHRKGGIGLAMVAHATQELKRHGVDEGYIHYTSLENWYAKLGYKTFLRYFFEHKVLSE